MSKNQRRKQKSTGYKPVETQELEKEKEINSNPPSPPISKPSNPYHVVGNARLSKTGQSLSIRLNENGHYRYLTILKTDIIALFTDENQNSVCNVREYENPIVTKQD